MAQTETVDSAFDVLTSFQKRKEVRDNDTGIRAQRLVNIYRHLSSFPKSYVQDFNKQLLEASPEVQMSLGNIVGGNIVRQYLDYLKNKMGQPVGEKEDQNTEYLPEKSYLPSPEDDQLGTGHTSFNQPLGEAPHSSFSPINSVEPFMDRFFSKQHEESVKQSEFFQRAIQQLQEGLSHQIQSISEQSRSSKETHEELQKMQQEIITQTVERIVKLQTDIFTKALSNVIQDTKRSYRPIPREKVSFLQNENESETQYPIIEEDGFLSEGPELKKHPPQSAKKAPNEQHSDIQTDKKG